MTYIVACIIPVVMFNQTIAPIDMEEFSQVQKATVYRHQGDVLKLNQQQIKEFQNMMATLSVKEDLMEESRLMAYDVQSKLVLSRGCITSKSKDAHRFFFKRMMNRI